MCVNIKYICPFCRTKSGKSGLMVTHDDHCEGSVDVRQVMKAEHFQNWFCETAGCGYSREEQREEAKTLMEALDSQFGAGISGHESDGRVDDGPGMCDSAQDGTLQDNMDVDMDSSKNAAANLAIDPSLGNPGPVAGVEQEGDMVAEDSPGAAVSSNRRVILDPQTVAIVDELQEKIANRAPLFNARTWLDEECRLLALLRSHGMSHRQISEDYLTRHSANACMTRVAGMKKRQVPGA
ncbi:hypothetical protein B0I37DRAFT_430614 [Chaetomium sp. MPI-CAGE-AT-0009]|nr:hypothetical protein B0I37DRAFT_430614 [Chaetomium sp. MPI-CAGE-AT-0009]